MVEQVCICGYVWRGKTSLWDIFSVSSFQALIKLVMSLELGEKFRMEPHLQKLLICHPIYKF